MSKGNPNAKPASTRSRTTKSSQGLDLDKAPKMQPYEITLNGKKHTYDALTLTYHFFDLKEDTVADLKHLHETVQNLTGLTLTSFQALQIVNDFIRFSEKEVDTPLKKAFGRSLFSTTPTESPKPNTDN